MTELLAAAVQTIQASDQYKLLQRLEIDNHPGLASGITSDTPKIGISLDTETTGFIHGKDKVIELGMVVFEFITEPSFQILRIIDRYSGFEDPCQPLVQDVINVTGITAEMLAGAKV